MKTPIKKQLTVPFKPRVWLTIATLMAPVAYMVGSHIQWEGNLNDKYRMATKQAGFWGAWALAVYQVHKRKWATWSPLGITAFLGTMAVLPIFGYLGGRILARTLFPKAQPVKPTQYASPQFNTTLRQSTPAQNNGPTPYPLYWPGYSTLPYGNIPRV